MVALDIPSDYKYVLVVFACTFFMNAFLVVRVAKARKLYDVQYPNLYAPAGHKYAMEFNSVQRAHQNTLESMSTVITQMLVVGLFYPVFAAACGGLWTLGRIVYGIGYAFGPDKRVYGGLISHLGDLPLQIALIRVAYDAYTTWQ